MDVNERTGDSTRIKLNAGDPKHWATVKEIRAIDGMKADYHDAPCTIAGNYDGYITAVTDNGAIIQDWAGEFTIKGES